MTVASKSKVKSSSATLRIYQTFFSVINTKNFLSIGRWFCNDVSKYAAIDESLFMFEIVARLGTRTQIIKLQVQNSAYDIVKVFESVAPGNSSKYNTVSRYVHHWTHKGEVQAPILVFFKVFSPFFRPHIYLTASLVSAHVSLCVRPS